MSDNPDLPRVRQKASDLKLLAASKHTIDLSRQLLIDTELQTDPHRLLPRRNFVTLIHDGDVWHVLVEEAGQAPASRTFEMESYATSYAEGQRIRLNLDKVDRG
ncbi:conserved hypothetical protein [Mesorhizobium plurifarium]|uniref:Uncharacterized protein n=1 Tax=Mesorhizobium plurifarium TaxID=69974 RepID=A0A090DWF2_MESPL|nr:conserved hypothetical protein [Mesorhizobium plurifarium]